MKPRTKIERLVEESASKLKPLSDKQFNEAVKKYGLHIAKADSKGNCTCLDCGHVWKEGANDSVICPECKARLKVDRSRTRNFSEKKYFTVVTTCNGFQVYRIFMIETILKKGEAARYGVFEAFQRWFTPNGKGYVRSLTRNSINSYYIDSWSRYSSLELRGESFVHREIFGNELSSKRYISELKRNGFDGCYYDCNPYDLVSMLLSNVNFETLWKTGNKNIAVNMLLRGKHNFNQYWTPLKIALRHKYDIKDFGIWTDMIDSLVRLGKDIHNPKFVCPDNLMLAHDKLVKEVRNKAEKERVIEARKKYLADIEAARDKDEKYIKSMGKFLGLVFCDEEITVKPLSSVLEFLEEGTRMHHCVYANKYYEKKDTLILHALVEGVSIATIELNLKTMKILQCRGVCNSVPEKKGRIEGLIKKNINQIIKINAA